MGSGTADAVSGGGEWGVGSGEWGKYLVLYCLLSKQWIIFYSSRCRRLRHSQLPNFNKGLEPIVLTAVAVAISSPQPLAPSP